MATSNPALVNPHLLSWAREQSGFAPEPVAKRLDVKPERLLAWERGEIKPTVRQAQQLAKFYHRPFGLFFLPQPPVLPPLAAEYRRLTGITPGVESPELRLALRVMSYRREVALELLEEMRESIAEFTTAAHLAEAPLQVGRRLHELLGISVQEQFGWRDEWQAWRRWRQAVETVGVLVFQFPKVSLEQVRGLSLLTFPLPVIGMNSKESAPGARVFTLLHELTHIALAVGQEERAALGEPRDDAAWSKVERFAEEAASAAIIPEESLAGFLRHMSVPRDEWDVDLVRSLAAKFRVTALAMATRLRAAGALTWEGYENWRDAWGEYLTTLKPRSKGFATPVDKTLGRGGRPFTQLVIEALDLNRITAAQACRYLDLRFEHFEKLRSELRERGLVLRERRTRETEGACTRSIPAFSWTGRRGTTLSICSLRSKEDRGPHSVGNLRGSPTCQGGDRCSGNARIEGLGGQAREAVLTTQSRGSDRGCRDRSLVPGAYGPEGA